MLEDKLRILLLLRQNTDLPPQSRRKTLWKSEANLSLGTGHNFVSKKDSAFRGLHSVSQSEA